VEDCIVLDIYAIADAYRTDIPAQHGSIPYAAVVAHFHCSDYRCRFRQKRTLSDYGPVALEFPDYCHEAKIHIL
jgi:hypothetical protein